MRASARARPSVGAVSACTFLQALKDSQDFHEPPHKSKSGNDQGKHRSRPQPSVKKPAEKVPAGYATEQDESQARVNPHLRPGARLPPLLLGHGPSRLGEKGSNGFTRHQDKEIGRAHV